MRVNRLFVTNAIANGTTKYLTIRITRRIIIFSSIKLKPVIAPYNPIIPNLSEAVVP